MSTGIDKNNNMYEVTDVYTLVSASKEFSDCNSKYNVTFTSGKTVQDLLTSIQSSYFSKCGEICLLDQEHIVKYTIAFDQGIPNYAVPEGILALPLPAECRARGGYGQMTWLITLNEDIDFELTELILGHTDTKQTEFNLAKYPLGYNFFGAEAMCKDTYRMEFNQDTTVADLLRYALSDVRRSGEIKIQTNNTMQSKYLIKYLYGKIDFAQNAPMDKVITVGYTVSWSNNQVDYVVIAEE